MRPSNERTFAASGPSGLTIHLTFHGLGTAPASVTVDEASVWVDMPAFLEMLDAVRDRNVHITFDDGNATDFTIAFPALLERGMTATFFVVTGRLGRPGYLDDKQVGEMASAGMSIGSHGMRHVPWRSLEGREVDEELAGARERLEQIDGVHVSSASCPFGAYDRCLLARLRRVGFEAVYTSDRFPSAPSDWLRPRYTVHRGDGVDDVLGFVEQGESRMARLRGRFRSGLKAFR